ncbi:MULTISPECIES: hypothetical protein [unclassified Spirosoma]|uniref:hypothetical protein n=1 Tax=unclassified Spirosoma TaxID=2621999 RepID=UPI000969F67A|nr:MULTISPECIES: hypothetical protein [unclassified Spirosoma]MBN8824002.1 hypothetical protein [Spirosoma sp.]OJW70413.1 MAG: hypothetical protein BGO59_24440 [Spirosoma sp. 48-14]
METTKQIEDEIPSMKKGQLNIYKPSDIKRWGVQRFLEETSVKEPFLLEFPEFTDEENKRMDEVLKEVDR